MATHYLYGTILTGEGVAANNRGDNIGNTTTLQKVFHQDDLHTSVSAEAIRFAIRYRFQLEGLPVNRSYDSSLGKLLYENEKRTYWNGTGTPFIDDDLMGFMDAAAAKADREEEESSDTKSKTKGKGKTTRRQSPLAIGRAVSLRPYRGEITFNAVSGEKEKGKLSLYNAEMHTTEYQYTFGLNLGDVLNKENISHFLDAIVDMPAVAGNHARFAYDFSPASLVLRVSSAHSSKIHNCFEHNEDTRSYTVEKLIRRVESGDIAPNELIVGGEIAEREEGKQLQTLGVEVFGGTRAAADEARRRIVRLDQAYSVLER
ncbi:MULTISPECIES: DevR family CRISPR-associated autoregulator [Brevibacillus]|uniref:DevR family CRISPR-associated autoregulator n=1 Tax=Brevibacillus invocatus TaxID=173959 RepID=A0A3M8C2J2_9BACL|nr:MULTISPECIES: DevR family CRISPR-associated autoregulator [Brevibacillus]MDH4618963.1 DevR family CRISPR-associated autoregulator [Brevibacillus sp. AY1]RNB69930.1 DevR family CRISPR-associated autoregulator [Brevibacillus invocatus]